MFLAALIQAAVALAASGPPAGEGLTAREKAALLVVSGLPAPPGVGGVIVQRGTRELPRPSGALVFVDQEGGTVRAFRELPPARAPRSYERSSEAFATGRATGRALRRAGVHVDLAPVLDAARGPLGPRHFRSSDLGLAFARGLAAGGVAGCAKHFPGLGSAAISTDLRPHVAAVVRPAEVAAFRSAVAAGIPCVMTAHAFYPAFGVRFRGSLQPAAYGLLRGLGFEGVAITDSLSMVREAPVERWAPQAVRAGADLVLFNNPGHARRAVAALVPLARRGELDEHVERVLRFRQRYGRGS